MALNHAQHKGAAYAAIADYRAALKLDPGL